MQKTLLRQLKKVGLTPDQPPKTAEQWADFLRLIEETYSQTTEDRYLLERSLELSSREMRERLEKNELMSLQLAQAAKMALLGTLASGVAHELNNPLQIIKGFAELLLMDPRDPEAVKDQASKILQVTERASSIVHHLLRLSRQERDGELVEIQARAPVDDALEFLGKQFEFDNIRIVVESTDGDIQILGHINRLSSVFQNLLTNARDAFHSHPEINDRLIRIGISKNTEGRNVIITFLDNAGGIPEAIVSQVFDPFFTTKEVGKGTGLGLSLAKQTIEEMTGTISVEVEGGGTRFKIQLPLALQTGSTVESVGSADLQRPVEWLGSVDDADEFGDRKRFR